MSAELVNMSELANHVSDGYTYHLPEILGIHLELPTICGFHDCRDCRWRLDDLSLCSAGFKNERR